MNSWQTKKRVVIPSKWTWIILGTISVACFALTIFFVNLPSQISYAKQFFSNKHSPVFYASEIPVSDSANNAIGLPVHLTIPKIHVDTVLEQVGLTPNGEVGVPKGRSNAAWFSDASRPGEVGSAILTGHYGYWKDGTSTVFNHLDRLKKGDRIFVDDELGVVRTFIVRELRTFDAQERVPDVFGSSDGKAHVNLITCKGTWNPVTQSYPKRLVVFTDQE